MKCVAMLVLLLAPSVAAVNPLEKVYQLMDDLTAKLVKDGEDEAKAYNEYFEWCDDTTKNMGFEIKTYTAKKGKLEAKITELTEDSEAASAKIEDLAGRIAQNDKDLTDATAVFDKDTKEFGGAEAELAETVDTLARAIGIIEKEMAKNPASFAQIDTSILKGLLSALSTVAEAASFGIADQKKLASLIQSQDDDMQAPGAPSAANYKSQSGGILDVLEDMKDKAEGQLDSLRKEYVQTKHNFEMMKQSLESQLSADNKNLAEEKTAKAEAEEGKATAEKDLATTVKLLADADKSLASANSNCMQVAADHDSSIKGRAEELKVIAEAKKIIQDSTGGSEDRTYSLVQLSSQSRLKTRADLAGKEVVMAVKKLAHDQHSKSLAQLASKIEAEFQFGASSGGDPFEKVKGLLKSMIEKLENEAGAAADEKAYCDEQMSKTEAKKGDLEDDVEALKVRIDEATSASAGLKDDVKTLQEELAALAKEQAEMDKVRSDTHAAYLEAQSDLTKGLGGVRKALGVLRDYYGSAAAMLQEGQPAVPNYHSKSGGAGGSIISILEVCESDLAKNLAEVERAEADEAADYEKTTQENEVTKTTKEKDAKYKTQEYKSLDSEIAEKGEDLKATSAELDAVLKYYEQVKQRCIAKAETYEERVKRRTAEIKGLKEALSILENETAFVQRRKHSRSSFLGF